MDHSVAVVFAAVLGAVLGTVMPAVLGVLSIRSQDL